MQKKREEMPLNDSFTKDICCITKSMNAQQEYDAVEESMSIIDPAIPFSSPVNGWHAKTSKTYLKTTDYAHVKPTSILHI